MVTIVVPTHNRADLLTRLLDSLTVQTYPRDRMELLVVDNASADNTASVVEAFASASPFNVSYHLKNYNGPSRSRDFGARHATGEIIAYVDSDCVVTPQWVEKLAAPFARSSIGLVQGKTLPNPHQRKYLFERTISITHEGPVYETCNIAYRKEAILQAGGFSDEYDVWWPFGGEDMDLAWKVKGGYDSTFAEDAIVYHHVFKMSLWQWLIQPRSAMIWPLMVRKFPQVRAHLCGKLFLFRITALFDLLLAGVILGIALHWGFVLLSLPYVVYRYLDSERHRNPLLRLGRVIFCLPRAMVLFMSLLYGSIRFRRLVL